MKKIFYLIMLTFIILPLSAKADVNLEEIHNSISETGTIEVKSIPIDYYKRAPYFDECLENYMFDSNAENMCLNDMYTFVVNSYLSKNITLPEDYRLWASCDRELNTCNVSIGSFEFGMDKEYNINFVGEYNEKIFNDSLNVANKINKNYTLTDMAYINQMINFENEHGYHTNLIYNSHKIFKIFPELKEELEKNKKYKYIPVQLGVGGGPYSYGSGGMIVIYDNDVAVNISKMLSYGTLKIVHIPNNTLDTDEAYINAALERIREYVNDESINITITKDDEYILNNVYDFSYDVSFEYNSLLNDSNTYIAKFYKLTINGVDNAIGILPLPNGQINKLNVKSTNYKTGINVETESSDVPLDTTVDAIDVSDSYKNYLKAYDIDLYSEIKDEYITRIKDGIIVRIPILDSYKEEYMNIYHIEDNGDRGEKYKAKIEIIDGKKYAVFTTNHFSTYALESNNSITNPTTYDSISYYIFLGILSMSILIVSITRLKKFNN